MNLTNYDKQILQKIFAQDAAIGSVFDLFTRSISLKLMRLKEGGWDKNPLIENQIDYELERLQKNLDSIVFNNHKWAFNLSTVKNDELVKNYIKGMAISSNFKEKLFGVNREALNAFLNRKEEGLNISERVWNITAQTKEQIGYYLETGIATGRSAQGISQDIKQILRDPDKLFRRVRDSKGNLVPSKPMKGFHPGQGVYRSSHQNAVRLAATETNMAYRMADHSRWQDLDFVIGYKVVLSRSHPATDICDNLQGIYPKDFIFRGWHPRCFCHAEPILMPQDEYIKYMNADKETAQAILEKHSVNIMPKGAIDFIDNNQGIIDRYKSPPYWVKDNFKDGKISKGRLINYESKVIIQSKVKPKNSKSNGFWLGFLTGLGQQISSTLNQKNKTK